MYLQICLIIFMHTFIIYIYSIYLQVYGKTPMWYSQISSQRFSLGFVKGLSASIFYLSALVGFLTCFFILGGKKGLTNEIECLEGL